MALLASTKGTCGRRRVGCVLVDKNNHVISTGYNGVASGVVHCINRPCPGRFLASGTGLDQCEALHAEENALIQCTRPNDIHTVYSTTSPCVFCVRRLMNTGAKRIVFAELYPHPESENLWTNKNHQNDSQPDRSWKHLPWDQLLCIASIRQDKSEPGFVLWKEAGSAMGTPWSVMHAQPPGSKTESNSMDQEEDSNSRPG